MPPELLKQAKRLRRRVDLPLAVGFGISTPEQARAVGKVADGVVVGSALVRIVEERAGSDDLTRIFGTKARELSDALR